MFKYIFLRSTLTSTVFLLTFIAMLCIIVMTKVHDNYFWYKKVIEMKKKKL